MKKITALIVAIHFSACRTTPPAPLDVAEGELWPSSSSGISGLCAACRLAAEEVDHVENHRGAALQVSARDRFVRLMRLGVFTGATDERMNTRISEPSTVGTKRCPRNGR